MVGVLRPEALALELKELTEGAEEAEVEAVNDVLAVSLEVDDEEERVEDIAAKYASISPGVSICLIISESVAEASD